MDGLHWTMEGRKEALGPRSSTERASAFDMHPRRLNEGAWRGEVAGSNPPAGDRAPLSFFIIHDSLATMKRGPGKETIALSFLSPAPRPGSNGRKRGQEPIR